jgi:hypothetical protein
VCTDFKIGKKIEVLTLRMRKDVARIKEKKEKRKTKTSVV